MNLKKKKKSKSFKSLLSSLIEKADIPTPTILEAEDESRIDVNKKKGVIHSQSVFVLTLPSTDRFSIWWDK